MQIKLLWVLAGALVVVSGVLPFATQAQAQATNKNIITTKVELTTGSARVSQSFLLTNASQFKQLQRLELKLPYKISGAVAKKDNDIISAISIGDTLVLDFAAFPVRPNQQALISLEYNSTDLVYAKGGLQRLTLPFLQLDNGAAISQVELSYPSAYGEVIYSNEQVQALEDDGSVTKARFDSRQDLLVTIGNPFGVSFDLVWQAEGADTDRILTLPGKFTSPRILGTEGLGKAWIDHDNYFAQVSSAEGANLAGRLQISTANNYEHYDTQTTWTETANLSSISDATEFEQIYSDLLTRYHPSQSLQLHDKDFVTIMAGGEQDALDYSASLATLLANQDIKSTIVLGLVNVPYTKDWIWSSWLNYEYEGQTRNADPYLEDLTRLPMGTQIEPMRIALATIQDFAQASKFDLGLVTIPEQSIDFQPNAVLGSETTAPSISFEMVAAEAGFAGEEIPITIFARNASSVPVYIKSLTISGSLPRQEEWEQLLVLPGNSVAFDLSGIHSPNPFVPDNFDLSAVAVLSDGVEEYEFTSTKEIYLRVDSARLVAFAGLALASFFLVLKLIPKLKNSLNYKLRGLTESP